MSGPPPAATTPAESAAPPSATLAHSPSTALLRGTQLVQSSPAALAAAAAESTRAVASSASSARLPLVQYKGGTEDSQGLADGGSAQSASSRRAAAAAAKLQSREELRAAFGVFDPTGAGSISTSEFASVYRMLVAGVSEAEIAEAVATLDANKDGRISFHEFASLMETQAQARIRMAGGGNSLLDEALSVFDSAAGDGPAATTLLDARMPVSELLHICDLLRENLSADETDTLLREMQIEADGSINYARLVAQLLPPGGM